MTFHCDYAEVGLDFGVSNRREGKGRWIGWSKNSNSQEEEEEIVEVEEEKEERNVEEKEEQ